MHGRLYLFTPGEDKPKVTFLSKAPDLELLRDKINGGFIEMVPYFRSFVEPGEETPKACTVYCDEDGKLKKLLFNRLATEHWHNCIRKIPAFRSGQLDVLVGPIIVLVGDKEFMKAHNED